MPAADFAKPAAVAGGSGQPHAAAERSANTAASAPPAASPAGTPGSHAPAAAAAHVAAKTSGIARQLAGAVPANAFKGGATRALHVSLTPQTLGNIQLKLEHRGSGAVRVTITASQPETLVSIKKDVSHLNEILTNAGLPEAGRQVEFRVAPVAGAQSAGLGNAGNAAAQDNAGGQPAPRHGTGLADPAASHVAEPSFNATSLAARTLFHRSGSGNVDVIA